MRKILHFHGCALRSAGSQQKNVTIVYNSQSKRLEIGRYLDVARVENGELRVGHDRNNPNVAETALESSIRDNQNLEIRAIDLCNPDRLIEVSNPDSRCLPAILGKSGGPWLVQPVLEGRVQRPVFWSTEPLPEQSRAERIGMYAEKWNRLISEPLNPEWTRLLSLVATAKQGVDLAMLDEIQAIAAAPATAIILAMRVPETGIAEIRELETAIPIFWPTVPISEFKRAFLAEHNRWTTNLLEHFGSEDAEAWADRMVVERANKVLTIMPELAGHFGCALLESGLMDRALDQPEMHKPLTLMLQPLQPNSEARRSTTIQGAAQRFDYLPSGLVRNLPKPLFPPPESAKFTKYLGALINAPFVAAEMAAELREQPGTAEKLTLINLRLVDPEYFDAALPTAIGLLQPKRAQA